MTDTLETNVWLTNTEAAERLGIHPSTLRRWADSGQLPVMLTPGGHRRFSSADLDSFADQRRRLRVVAGLEDAWAEQTLSITRTEVAGHGRQGWLESFNEEDREEKRELGRRLMGLMLQFVSAEEADDALLLEARDIGKVHAKSALGAGLPLTVPLKATMFFRDMMMETALQLPETMHIRPEANLRLVRRINTMVNEIQLAIAATYSPDEAST